MDSNFKPFLKYKQAVMIILVYYLLFLSLMIYFNSSETYADPTNLTPLIPINNIYVEVALIFLVFAPISALIGGLIGGYFLTPVFL